MHCIFACFLSSVADAVPHTTTLTAPQVTPPDVWARLQQECMRDPAALAVMYQHAQQRLAAQEQQLQEQAQQLQQARQQIQQLSQAV